MKSSIVIISLLIITLFFCNCNQKNKDNKVISKTNNVNDDGSVKATNCDCSLFTNGEFTWDGECVNGYADGTGTIRWVRTNEKYVGTVSVGKITGKGTKYISEKIIYDGDWVDGVYSGKGSLFFNKNLIYSGDWINGEKSGMGTSYYENGRVLYQGDFKMNEPNGYGEKNDSSGLCIRKGNFTNGQFSDEEEVQRLGEKIGRRVVQEVFNGGTKINTQLFAVKYNEDKSEKEITIDLKFNGNILENREYKCRVVCRNYYPEIEFLEKDDNVEMYLTRNKIITSILGEKKSYGFFE